MEALLNAPHAIRKVFLAPGSADEELRKLLERRQILVSALKQREASHMVGADASHQGVIAIADPAELMIPFDHFLENLRITPETMLVLLDELTDPHNVGAIIRSAAAFGAAGVLIPPHNQAPITGAVVKASAGMVFRVPVVSIGNVNHTVRTLKEKGFLMYALTAKGERIVGKEPFAEPALVIVGNEAKGIREKTLELADVTLRIPMHPRTESLNASVSAAIVLATWSAAHPSALKEQRG